MVNELVPWVDSALATSGSEQNWLIGFSKSGYGGQDLILRDPGVFTVAASWDFPADMSSYDYLRLEPGHGLRHRSQLCQQLPAQPGVRGRPQGAVHDQGPDLAGGLRPLPPGHGRL